MMKVEIIREEPSGLARQVWRFSCHASYSDPCQVLVQEYRNERRTTKRHAWQAFEGYGFHDPQTRRTRKDPFPLPDGVVIEAAGKLWAQVEEAIHVMKSIHRSNAAKAKT